ncbi:MAG: hypothetical protein ACNA8O_03310 [Cyanobacteriota bacterium]
MREKALRSTKCLGQYLSSRKSSDSAFLVATGPSIKEQQLELLAGHDVFTISNAFLHHRISAINPIVHGFCAYHKPLQKNNFADWIKAANERLPAGSAMVTPFSNQCFVGDFGIARQVFFCEHISFRLARRLGWPRMFSEFIPRPATGPLLLLPIILGAGYKKIYLLGCDHNVLANYGGVISNFYDPKDDIRVNATSGEAWGDIKYQCYCLIQVIEQYEYYSKIAQSCDSQIVNLSPSSWLSTFPKKGFLEALQVNVS